jgi:hypothetical protein
LERGFISKFGVHDLVFGVFRGYNPQDRPHKVGTLRERGQLNTEMNQKPVSILQIFKAK